MMLTKGIFILIPSGTSGPSEFMDSGLHRKITGEGYVTMVPNSVEPEEMHEEIQQIMARQKPSSVFLFGASEAGLEVIRLMIDDSDGLKGGIAVSPPFAEELRYKLSRIEKPLLVVNGSDDAEYYLKSGRSYHDLVEGSRHRVLKGGGHMPHVSTAERFFLLLKKFLDDEF